MAESTELARSGWSRGTLFGVLGLSAAAALLFAFSPTAGGKLPRRLLPRLSGGEPLALADCAAKKCLTVYVAPWCGYCRAGTPAIVALREHLRAHDVPVRVVVGMDREENVRDYAREFGPETALDPGGSVGVQGGVPHFYVSDGSGRILNEIAGLPQDVMNEPADLAAYFGLP